MSESRKIQASIQSPQIIRQPIDALAFMRRYDNIAESRQRLLNYQRVKVPPSELVKLKLKKKATKLKRTTNLKGEVAKNIIEQKKFEKGQRRDKPEQDIRIVGEPAPPVNIYQQPAPGGLQFDPAIERQRLALEDRRRQDDYNLAQRKLVIEATNYDINKALADREYDLQNRRLHIEDRNRQVEIQALFDRQQEEIRQFDILQEQRRKDRKLEKRLRLEELEAAEERFDRERQLQEEARRQFEESRVIRLPAGREQELQSQTRFLPGGGPPPISELTGRRPGSTATEVSAEQPPPTLSRREQPSELVRQAARVQANIDSRLNEFQREEDQRRAQREAQFLTRGLSQVDDLITRRFSELEQRQQQAQRAALEPEFTAEEQEQVRHRIYDSILAGIQPQGVLAQQIEGEVESATQDIREAQRLETQQLRAEILDRQKGLITAPQLEDQLRREQAERARLEQRLATIETDVARIQTPRSTPTSTPGTSPGDIATEFEEIRRSQLESSGSEAGSLGTSGSELIFQFEEGEQEQVAAEPGIATRAAQTVGETLAAGGQFIADYFQAPKQVAEQETRGIGRPLSLMERGVQVIEERKKQARRPQPGEQTGGALVDAEGNPIYGLGQDFPEEFQEEIEIAEAQLAAKQRSDEEQRQILAAAKAAEEQRKQKLRKAEQEAEAKARRIAKAEETAKRRDEELAQIREARLAQERSDLEQRAGGVLPEPAPEAPVPQVRKAKPPDKPPTQPTGEVVRQVKPKVARGQVEDVAEEPTRRAQVATEGEALVEEAQGAGTEPQSAIRTNFTTYQSLLPEIQQLNAVGRPKAQRQTNIYIKNTSDAVLRGLEPGQETLITGYESQNNGTLGFFTEGKRKRTQKNVIEKLIKEGKIKIYKK
jgi:colicin import membrane protein